MARLETSELLVGAAVRFVIGAFLFAIYLRVVHGLVRGKARRHKIYDIEWGPAWTFGAAVSIAPTVVWIGAAVFLQGASHAVQGVAFVLLGLGTFGGLSIFLCRALLNLDWAMSKKLTLGLLILPAVLGAFLIYDAVTWP